MTHHRAKRRRERARSHELRTQAIYGLSAEQYVAIYEYQGRCCFICQRATGATKKLAVDHDHDRCGDHAPDTGCPDCVRALLCGPCNQLIGRWDIAALRRAITVLTEPPAQRVLFAGE